jgi:hypothetical protein
MLILRYLEDDLASEHTSPDMIWGKDYFSLLAEAFFGPLRQTEPLRSDAAKDRNVTIAGKSA